jgi:hypothetical protein
LRTEEMLWSFSMQINQRGMWLSLHILSTTASTYHIEQDNTLYSIYSNTTTAFFRIV